MHRIARLLRRLGNVLRPHRSDPDLEREIASHLTLLEDEYVRRGMTRDDARRQARVAFGGVERVKERQRDARSIAWIGNLRRDVRYALRLLARSPVFATTAIVSLAIGLAATTTVFTAIDALLVRTAPGVTDPDRLVDISLAQEEIGVEPIAREQYAAIRERVTRVTDVYAYSLNLTPMSWLDESGNPAQAVFTDLVTPNYFTALGVTPAVGRVFTERDAAPVVVLSDRFWRTRRGSDPLVVGSVMRLGDKTLTVVGVARPEFHGNTVLAPDLWIAAGPGQPLDTGLVGARLAPGVTRAEARAEIEGIGPALPPGPDTGRQRALFTGLRLDRSSPVPYGVRLIVGGFLSVLLAIVSLVLIVACANVAGLLLARGTGRAQEMAIRVAMGVSRGRLVGQLLIETLLLFALGGAAGLLLARAMTAAILRVLPSMPLPSDASLTQDGRVVAFALGLSLAAAVTFGLAPAIRATRVDVLALLKAQEQGAGSSLRLRRAFVMAQVALSAVLVVVGGLLARALGRTASVESGFDARGVDVVAIDLATAGYTPDAGRAFIEEAARRLRALPDFQSVALASETPVSGAQGYLVSVPGFTPRDGRPLVEMVGNAVTPGYFATLRIPLLAGRDVADADTAAGGRVAVLTESAVRRFWRSPAAGDAVGRQILLQPNLIERGNPSRTPSMIPVTVVGVVGDLRNGGTPRPFIYLPLPQQYTSAVKIVARARGGERGVAGVRDLLLGMDRRLPVLSAASLEDQAGPTTTQVRISAAIAGSLGIVAVLLAAIGVYGVTSYMVARRTREIGIRVALGADRRAVVRMTVGESARLIVSGAALGLPLAVVAGRLLRAQLFGVSPIDPLTFGGVIVLFTIVALAASYVPVRRALAIDPSRALRYE